MSATDIVKNLMTALEANDIDTAGSMLTDDFVMDGWTPQPLDKQGFLQLISRLKEGIPGLIFNLHNVREEGNRVYASWQVVGYQSDSLNLPMLSLPPIPQMGRSISLPTEDVEFAVDNERIKRLLVRHTDGGGIHGLLHQLGTDAPIIQ